MESAIPAHNCLNKSKVFFRKVEFDGVLFVLSLQEANMAQNMSASGKLRSERVVVEAPLSYAGSAKRIWKITDQENTVIKYLLVLVALTLVFFAWTFVTIWYCTWGLLLVPYRMIRKGGRKDKRQALQHREQLEALTSLQANQVIQTANLIEQNKNKSQ